jgi:hypothetical protein
MADFETETSGLFSERLEDKMHVHRRLCIYCPVSFLKGEREMRESDDPRADLEDLIYDEDVKKQSER